MSQPKQQGDVVHIRWSAVSEYAGRLAVVVDCSRRASDSPRLDYRLALPLNDGRQVDVGWFSAEEIA